MPETISFRRRKLPHWRVANRPYFVTFRLYGTIPAKVVKDLREKRKAVLSDCELRDRQKREFMRIEEMLDNADSKVKYLGDGRIAGMVLDNFNKISDEFDWRFPAVVIMPNHVHCLCCGEKATISLDGFLKRLKGRTAFEANRILGRRGMKFWASESFDHWCRSADKVESVKKYIRNNPVKAGLVKSYEDWPWLVEE